MVQPRQRPVNNGVPAQAPLAAITPAEQRVLALVSRGHSNRHIAQTLLLSHRTVESHVSSLLAKSGSRNRTQLTLWSQARSWGDA